ncbi:MAG TPA: L,D-transpeptidase family protein [Ohtaekwangia sp.]|uniref:L,D-transpeptidase family protein n=1 Tax=Ohtaekwangia sp. TaxID=2066019 RepID=UPI002F94EC96
MKKLLLLLLVLLPAAAAIYYYLPEEKLAPGIVIDKLVVNKKQRTMQAFSEGRVVKVYHIAIGKASGDKLEEGDQRTPEGTYRIADKNPNSGYHKNLGISYPNKKDIQEAKQRGVKPGGNIKIHGLKNGQGYIGKFHRLRNWTNGCIALTDEEVDELYNHVRIGAIITIRP